MKLIIVCLCWILLLIICILNYDKLKESIKYESSHLTDAWCEDKYSVHEYIFEFQNSLTSLVISLLGFFIIYYYKELSKIVEPKIDLVAITIIIVGLGSVYFHVTMSIAGQILDEVPIFVAYIYALTIIRSREYIKSKSIILYNIIQIMHDINSIILITCYLTVGFIIYPPISMIFIYIYFFLY